MGDFSADQVMNPAGRAGVVVYPGSCAPLQSAVLRGRSESYAIFNLCAASLLLLGLSVAFNLPSAIIQSSWIVISLPGIAWLIWMNRRARFTDEEWDMPRPLALRFLDRGDWVDAEPGAPLLREGEPVTNLDDLARGQVRGASVGQVIGKAGAGLFGERNVLAGGPAPARVMPMALARLVVISGAALQSMAARDSEFPYPCGKRYEP